MVTWSSWFYQMSEVYWTNINTIQKHFFVWVTVDWSFHVDERVPDQWWWWWWWWWCCCCCCCFYVIGFYSRNRWLKVSFQYAWVFKRSVVQVWGLSRCEVRWAESWPVGVYWTSEQPWGLSSLRQNMFLETCTDARIYQNSFGQGLF